MATAVISDSERKFIVEGVQQDVRCDGRSRLDYRLLSVECGVLPLTNGSARVKLIGGHTEVLAAVKVELGKPTAEKPNQGSVECNVEYWTSAGSQLRERDLQEANTELSASLQRIITAPGAVDLTKLCVLPKRYAWNVFIDVTVLDSGGSVLDTCTMAVYAALRDTELPKLRLVRGEGSGSAADAAAAAALLAELDAADAAAAAAAASGAAAPAATATAAPATTAAAASTTAEAAEAAEADPYADIVDVDLDADPSAFVPFPWETLPLAVTFTQVGGMAVVDATQDEEAVADARVCVGVTRGGSVCGMETDGAAGLGVGTLHAALEAARRVAPLLFERLDAAIKAHAQRVAAEAAEGEAGLHIGAANVVGTRGAGRRRAALLAARAGAEDDEEDEDEDSEGEGGGDSGDAAAAAMGMEDAR